MNSNRSVSDIKSELTINGSKDCFIEDIETNYSLIKKRIKNKLNYISLFIGKYSKTEVRILYIDSITDIRLINNIKKKIR